MEKNYRHLDLPDRCEIYRLRADGISLSRIARTLGRIAEKDHHEKSHYYGTQQRPRCRNNRSAAGEGIQNSWALRSALPDLGSGLEQVALDLGSVDALADWLDGGQMERFLRGS